MKKQLVIIGLTLVMITGIFIGCTENKTNPLKENEVVVESDSMSHGGASQIGIIDKGDIVQYIKMGNRSDIITWAQGKNIDYKKYGDYGDVILFKSMNDSSNQIVHRAMCWVEYNKEFNRYTLQDYGMTNVSNITITEFGLDEYKPTNSGFITKADNRPKCDQASGVCSQPVKVEWIIGKIVKLEDT